MCGEIQVGRFCPCFAMISGGVSPALHDQKLAPQGRPEPHTGTHPPSPPSARLPARPQSMHVLGMQGRGGERRPGVLGASSLAASACISCGQCSAVCPVGAITEASEWRQVMEELDAKRKVGACWLAWLLLA